MLQFLDMAARHRYMRRTKTGVRGCLFVSIEGRNPWWGYGPYLLRVNLSDACQVPPVMKVEWGGDSSVGYIKTMAAPPNGYAIQRRHSAYSIRSNRFSV